MSGTAPQLRLKVKIGAPAPAPAAGAAPHQLQPAPPTPTNPPQATQAAAPQPQLPSNPPPETTSSTNEELAEFKAIYRQFLRSFMLRLLNEKRLTPLRSCGKHEGLDLDKIRKHVENGFYDPPATQEDFTALSRLTSRNPTLFIGLRRPLSFRQHLESVVQRGLQAGGQLAEAAYLLAQLMHEEFTHFVPPCTIPDLAPWLVYTPPGTGLSQPQAQPPAAPSTAPPLVPSAGGPAASVPAAAGGASTTATPAPPMKLKLKIPLPSPSTVSTVSEDSVSVTEEDRKEKKKEKKEKKVKKEKLADAAAAAAATAMQPPRPVPSESLPGTNAAAAASTPLPPTPVATTAAPVSSLPVPETSTEAAAPPPGKLKIRLSMQPPAQPTGIPSQPPTPHAAAGVLPAGLADHGMLSPPATGPRAFHDVVPDKRHRSSLASAAALPLSHSMSTADLRAAMAQGGPDQVLASPAPLPIVGTRMAVTTKGLPQPEPVLSSYSTTEAPPNPRVLAGAIRSKLARLYSGSELVKKHKPETVLVETLGSLQKSVQDQKQLKSGSAEVAEASAKKEPEGSKHTAKRRGRYGHIVNVKELLSHAISTPLTEIQSQPEGLSHDIAGEMVAPGESETHSSTEYEATDISNLPHRTIVRLNLPALPMKSRLGSAKQMHLLKASKETLFVSAPNKPPIVNIGVISEEPALPPGLLECFAELGFGIESITPGAYFPNTQLRNSQTLANCLLGWLPIPTVEKVGVDVGTTSVSVCVPKFTSPLQLRGTLHVPSAGLAPEAVLRLGYQTMAPETDNSGYIIPETSLRAYLAASLSGDEVRSELKLPSRLPSIAIHRLYRTSVQRHSSELLAKKPVAIKAMRFIAPNVQVLVPSVPADDLADTFSGLVRSVRYSGGLQTSRTNSSVKYDHPLEYFRVAVVSVVAQAQSSESDALEPRPVDFNMITNNNASNPDETRFAALATIIGKMAGMSLEDYIPNAHSLDDRAIFMSALLQSLAAEGQLKYDKKLGCLYGFTTEAILDDERGSPSGTTVPTASSGGPPTSGQTAKLDLKREKSTQILLGQRRGREEHGNDFPTDGLKRIRVTDVEGLSPMAVHMSASDSSSAPNTAETEDEAQRRRRHEPPKLLVLHVFAPPDRIRLEIAGSPLVRRQNDAYRLVRLCDVAAELAATQPGRHLVTQAITPTVWAQSALQDLRTPRSTQPSLKNVLSNIDPTVKHKTVVRLIKAMLGR